MVKAMAMSAPERDFHIGRGLFHGVLGFAVFTILAMAFTGTEPFGGSLEKLGEAAARQAGWAFLLALAASYAYQTRRGVLASLLLAVMVGLFVFQLFALTRIAHARPDEESPLTAAERSVPVQLGRGDRLCQSALGFSFPAPDPSFRHRGSRGPAGSRPQSSPKDPFTARWTWQDPLTQDSLLVEANKVAGRDEAAFRAFASTFKGSLARQHPTAQLGPDEIRWSEQGGELDISFTEGERTTEVRCLSRLADERTPPLLVCVQTSLSPGGDALRKVRTGLSLAPCES